MFSSHEGRTGGVSTRTHPLQDIASCKAWDKLVELEKMKNTR